MGEAAIIKATGAPRRNVRTRTEKTAGYPAKMLRSIFEDLVMDRGVTGIVSFCSHAGISLPQHNAGETWWPTFSAHYRDGAALDQLCTDLATWGPIASRVMEIQLEARGHG